MCLSLYGKPVAELRNATCYLCTTCLALTPARLAGVHFTYLGGMEDWVDWVGGWLVIYRGCLPVCKQSPIQEVLELNSWAFDPEFGVLTLYAARPLSCLIIKRTKASSSFISCIRSGRWGAVFWCRRPAAVWLQSFLHADAVWCRLCLSARHGTQWQQNLRRYVSRRRPVTYSICIYLFIAVIVILCMKQKQRNYAVFIAELR